MGIAKRMMEEAESSFEAQWECPNCDHPNETYFEIPTIDMTSDYARDYHGSDTAEWECEECAHTIEGLITNGSNGVGFEFLDNEGERIHIEAETPRDDDYHDYFDEWEPLWTPSESPDDVYKVTLDGMRNLIGNESPSEHDDQLLNRLIFSQIITALEAYLADSLINLVKGDKEIQKKLFAHDQELKKVKFTGIEILENPDLPEKALIQHLQKLSFHNFPTIDKLFKTAIGTSIFVDDMQRDLLNAARIHRHDCVHRNGKTKEGEKLKIFDNAYILSIANSADSLVRHMQGNFLFL